MVVLQFTILPTVLPQPDYHVAAIATVLPQPDYHVAVDGTQNNHGP